MKPVTVTTTIARPPEQVQELLDDLMAHEAFVDHFLVDFQLLSESPRGVGAKVRLRAKAGGKNAIAEIEVVEAQPGRIVEHGRGGKDLKRRTTGTYELASDGNGGTRVSFTNTVEPTGLGDRLSGPLMRAYLRRQNARALERLREQMERGQVAPDR